MEHVPEPGEVPVVKGPIQTQVGAQAGDVLRPQRGVEVDARHVGAARAIHEHEGDGRHAQHHDDGGEEPPEQVLGQHPTSPAAPLFLFYFPSVTQTLAFQGRWANWLNGPKSVPWTRELTP